MKIAILSDIHGNLEAIETVLARIKADGCEKIYCLGDVVGYGPNPNECCHLLREREIPTTMGNHDEAASLDETSPDLELRMNRTAAESIRWTCEVLSNDNRKWLSALPFTIDLPGAPAVLCHANFHNPQGWSYIENRYHASLTFRRMPGQICFYGHTHVPGIISLNCATNEIQAREAQTLQISQEARYLINCGSIGQPRDGDHRSCYVVYDTAQKTVVFRRVPYPKEITQKKMIGFKLGHELTFRLSSGT